MTTEVVCSEQLATAQKTLMTLTRWQARPLLFRVSAARAALYHRGFKWGYHALNRLSSTSALVAALQMYDLSSWHHMFARQTKARPKGLVRSEPCALSLSHAAAG
jgi:hypothetical protein